MSGIVSIVFVALASYINYQTIKLLYPGAPMNFVEYNIVGTMLPFLFAVVISFLVAAYSLQASKPATEEMEPQVTETQPEQEADMGAPAEKEMEKQDTST